MKQEQYLFWVNGYTWSIWAAVEGGQPVAKGYGCGAWVKVIKRKNDNSYLYRVRSIAAIFFLMLLLFTQTPLQQLLKIPVLIEHYKEHRADSKNISLLDYIQLHYFSGNPKDADYERDMQLPFRANDVELVYSVVVIPEDYRIELLSIEYKELSYPLFGTAHLSPRHAHNIWQPPRMC